MLVAILGAAAISALALLGWQFQLPLLTGASLWGVAMNPLTAICLLFACGSLWVQSRSHPSPGWRYAARSVGLLIASVGCLRLGAVLVGLPFFLDQLIFNAKNPGTPYPNEMSPTSAAGLVFFGIALAALDQKARRGWRPVQIPLAITLGISLVALVGHSYGAASIYRIGQLKPMSPSSATALFLLSAGALLARSDSGPARLLLASTPGGLIFRRLLPAGVLLPLFFAWLRLEGQHRGYFGLEVGTALLVLSIVGLFIVLISMVARDLDTAEAKGAAAEGALTRSLLRQQRLTDANLIGVVTANVGGEITQANAEFLRIVGYSTEDLPIHSDVITPPEWRDRNRQAIAELAERGIAGTWEKEYVRKDGARVPVLVGAATLPGPEGEIVAFALDLSGQRKAEMKSARTQSFLDTVVENIPNMIFIKDARDLRFVRLNRAAENLIGIQREALLGKNDYDFFPKDQADFFTAKDQEVLRSGMLLDIPEEALATANGERFLHTKKVPIVDENGDPLYLLGISEDITERRDYERRLELLNQAVRRHAEQLEVSNKELEAFSYSVSHDLRAPLRHIGGFADLLLRTSAERLDEVGKRRLRTIIESAERMGELIDDLLAFSRMSRTELRRSPVNLTSLVQELVRECETGRTGPPIQWNIQPLHDVYADPAMLRLALTNLIANAIKYTGTREKPAIEISSETSSDGETIVRVKDNGVGFSMEYVGKLFGVFQRLHREEEFPGTGIGLANVRRIIHRHGGKTWAEGAVDVGATFYFSLPAQVEEETDGFPATHLAC